MTTCTCCETELQECCIGEADLCCECADRQAADP